MVVSSRALPNCGDAFGSSTRHLKGPRHCLCIEEVLCRSEHLGHRTGETPQPELASAAGQGIKWNQG